MIKTGSIIFIAILLFCGEAAHSLDRGVNIIQARTSDTQSVQSRVTDVQGKVNDVRSRVKDIQNRTDFIPLNADAKVRDLYRELDPQRVQELFDLFKKGNSPAEALKLVEVLRDSGFPEFRDGGGAEVMRADLIGVLDQLELVIQDVEKLRCVDDPDAELVLLQRGGKLDAFINVLPPVVLYAMKQMLDEMAEGWRTRLQEVHNLIPAGLTTLCNNNQGLQYVGVQNIGATAVIDLFEQQKVCEQLRPPSTLGDLRTLRSTLELVSRGFDMAKEFFKDEDTIGVNLVVFGGGGATKSVKLPAKPTFNIIANVLGKLSSRVDNLISRRDSCLEADAQMEHDLLQCIALAEYDLEFPVVDELAQRRVNELIAGALVDANDQLVTDVRNATTFRALCVAYQDLRGLPRVEPLQ
jgi:hypothetical protein